MRNVTILLAIAAVLSLAGPAWGWNDGNLQWNNTGTDGDWFTTGNWDEWDSTANAGAGGWVAGHVPTGSDYAYILNGGTANVNTGGSTALASRLYMGASGSDDTQRGKLAVGTDGDTDFGRVYAYQSGSTITVTGDGNFDGYRTYLATGSSITNTGTHMDTGFYEMYIAAYTGGGTTTTYNLQAGGLLKGTNLAVGYENEAYAVLEQTGGTCQVTHVRIADYDRTRGTYNLSGGVLDAYNVIVDDYGYYYNATKYSSGTWNITNAPTITIKTLLQFGGNANLTSNDCTFTAPAGAVIHMPGSKFENRCLGADGKDAKLAGLNNVTLLYDGTAEGDVDDFEVGGADKGYTDETGLTNNFALEGLTLAGGAGSGIKLVDLRDNHADGADNEFLYVETLKIMDGTVLDLNGLTLVFKTFDAAGTGSWVAGEGEVVANGGAIYQIPEPATMILLGIGGVGVLLRRRRK